ncbi:MAG: helix-turn-helix domain-containing protein [Desulfobacterales bacterium]
MRHAAILCALLLVSLAGAETRAGHSGMPVGEIQKKLKIPNSTLSHHLNHLKRVGLIRQEREGTVLRCFVDYEIIFDIVRFLTEECCSGDPIKITEKPV